MGPSGVQASLPGRSFILPIPEPHAWTPSFGLRPHPCVSESDLQVTCKHILPGLAFIWLLLQGPGVLVSVGLGHFFLHFMFLSSFLDPPFCLGLAGLTS